MLSGGILVPQKVAGAAWNSDCNETVEITVRAHPQRNKGTKEVPVAWYNQTKQVDEVSKQIESTYGEEAWFESTAKGSSNQDICGYNRPTVVVVSNDPEEAQKHLGNNGYGVLITIEEPTEGAPLDSKSEDDGEGLAILGGIIGLGGLGYGLVRWMNG